MITSKAPGGESGGTLSSSFLRNSGSNELRPSGEGKDGHTYFENLEMFKNCLKLSKTKSTTYKNYGFHPTLGKVSIFNLETKLPKKSLIPSRSSAFFLSASPKIPILARMSLNRCSVSCGLLSSLMRIF